MIMATEKTIKVSDFTKVLTKEEEAFLKDTIKNGRKLGCFQSDAYDENERWKEFNYTSYVPTTERCRWMMHKIWRNMVFIDATNIINTFYTKEDGHILLINVEYYKIFERWAGR